MAPTLKAVAEKAGVSIGTASRVINRHPNVSSLNRVAVEKAIQELEYHPDPAARSLRRLGASQQVWTGNIGVVFINTTTAMLGVPLIGRMVHAAQAELCSNGYDMMMSNTVDNSNLPDIVRDGKVEGLLLHGDLTLELCEKLSGRIPIVSMGQNDSHLSLAMVNVNNQASVLSAVRYLKERGHERIGFISRDPKHQDFAERLAGYREAHALLNLPYDPKLESVESSTPDWRPRTPEITLPAMDHLVDPLIHLPHPPTAVIVSNDWQAGGVYRSLQKHGVRIPQDMSVIGFDDDVQVCESLFPALTSIHYPSEVIGRQAVQLLLKRIKEKDSLTEQIQETVLVRSMLIERVSCQQRA